MAEEDIESSIAIDDQNGDPLTSKYGFKKVESNEKDLSKYGFKKKVPTESSPEPVTESSPTPPTGQNLSDGSKTTPPISGSGSSRDSREAQIADIKIALQANPELRAVAYALNSIERTKSVDAAESLFSYGGSENDLDPEIFIANLKRIDAKDQSSDEEKYWSPKHEKLRQEYLKKSSTPPTSGSGSSLNPKASYLESVVSRMAPDAPKRKQGQSIQDWGKELKKVADRNANSSIINRNAPPATPEKVKADFVEFIDIKSEQLPDDATEEQATKFLFREYLKHTNPDELKRYDEKSKYTGTIYGIGGLTPEDREKVHVEFYDKALQLKQTYLNIKAENYKRTMNSPQIKDMAAQVEDIKSQGANLQTAFEQGKIDQNTFDSGVANLNARTAEIKAVFEPLLQEGAQLDEQFNKNLNEAENYINRYPKEAARRLEEQEKQVRNDVLYETNGHARIAANTSFQIGQAVTNFAAKALSLPQVVSGLAAEGYGWTDRLADISNEWADAINKEFLPTPSKFDKPLIERDKQDNFRLNSELLVPKVVRTLSDMAIMAAPAFTGAGLAGTVAASYTLTAKDFYDEALEAGMSQGQASAFSNGLGLTTGLLELINPEAALMKKGLIKMTTQQAAKMLSGGVPIGTVIKEVGKTMGLNIAKENLQEFTQFGAEKISKYAANQLIGADFNLGDLQAEALETVVLTTLVAGIAGGGIGGVKARKSELTKSALYHATLNPEMTFESVQKAMEAGSLTPEQGNQIITQVATLKQNMDVLPDNIKESEKVELVTGFYDKMQLQEKVDTENMDSEVKKLYEDRIKAIDAGIAKIVKPYIAEDTAPKTEEELTQPEPITPTQDAIQEQSATSVSEQEQAGDSQEVQQGNEQIPVQETTQAGEEEVVPNEADLLTVETMGDAKAAQSKGDRIFVISEMDNSLIEIKNVNDLDGYTEDQVRVLPQKKSVESQEAEVLEGSKTSDVESLSKALDKLSEDQGYEIEGLANGYIKDVASNKLNDIIEETNLPDNIKAVIRKRFSLNSKGKYSSSIPFDRVVKSEDIQLTKNFIKDVGAEILIEKYGETSNEYSRELEKLYSGIDNYIQSLLNAEESGTPVKTNPEIAKVANILTDIQDKFNESDKNTPKTTAEAYYDAKEKGIENDFTKAVEQSLKETTKAGSVGVGGEVAAKEAEKVFDKRYGDISKIKGVGDKMLNKAMEGSSYFSKVLKSAVDKYIFIPIFSELSPYNGDRATYKFLPKPNENTKVTTSYRDWDVDKTRPEPIMYDKTLVNENGEIINNEYKSIYDKSLDIRSEDFDETHLYRGMSKAELDNAINRGYIKSDARANLGGQENTTSFAQHPSQATNYASGFTGWHDAATFNEPKYVVKISKKGVDFKPSIPTETRGEVDVAGEIPVTDILEIHELRLASAEAGTIDIREEYPDGKVIEGSRNGMSQEVVARKMSLSELKAVEQSLKEAPKAGSGGVGGDKTNKNETEKNKGLETSGLGNENDKGGKGITKEGDESSKRVVAITTSEAVSVKAKDVTVVGWHGTTSENASKIRDGGFKLLGKAVDGELGISFGGTEKNAYSQYGETLKVEVKLKNPIYQDAYFKEYDNVASDGFKKPDGKGGGKAFIAELKKRLIEKGYDGVIFTNEISVFNPTKENIKIVEQSLKETTKAGSVGVVDVEATKALDVLSKKATDLQKKNKTKELHKLSKDYREQKLQDGKTTDDLVTKSIVEIDSPEGLKLVGLDFDIPDEGMWFVDTMTLNGEKVDVYAHSSKKGESNWVVRKPNQTERDFWEIKNKEQYPNQLPQMLNDIISFNKKYGDSAFDKIENGLLQNPKAGSVGVGGDVESMAKALEGNVKKSKNALSEKVFRGSGERINETYGGRTDDGLGVFYTDNEQMAKWFSGLSEYNVDTNRYEPTGLKGKVETSKLEINNPYTIDETHKDYDIDNEHTSWNILMDEMDAKNKKQVESFVNKLISEGHDGIVLKGNTTNYYEDGTYNIYVKFTPEQFKKAVEQSLKDKPTPEPVSEDKVEEADIVKSPILKRINKAFLNIGTTIFDNAQQLMDKAKELSGVRMNVAGFTTRDGKPIGFNYDTDKVARERFDFSNLKKIGSGSDRDVYDLGNGKVLKVAKTARGLTQNIYEGDYYLKGIVPEVHERGLNYVVADNTPRLKSADVIDIYDPETNEQIGKSTAGQMLKDLSKFTQKDFDNKTSELQDVLGKYGLQDITSYEVLWNDFKAPRNWGYKDGTPMHSDGGTFGGVDMIDSHKGKTNLSNPEFRGIYEESKKLKKQFGDADKNTMYHYNDKGEILGFTHEGKIYLNGEKITAKTTMEEAGHVWINWAKQNRADLHKAGIDKVRGTKYLSDVEKNSHYQKEALKLGKKGSKAYNDYMAEEALSKAIADNGAKFVTDSRRNSFREWVNKMWREVIGSFGIRNLSPDQVGKLSIEQFAKMAAADVFNKDDDAFVEGIADEIEAKSQELTPKDLIAKGIEGIMNKIGGVKNLTEGERTTLYEDVKTLIEGIVKQTGVTLKEAINNAVELLKKYPNVTDQDIEYIKDRLAKEKRRFTQQFIKSEIPENLKEAVTEDQIYYSRFPNDLALSEANFIIDYVGEDQAQRDFENYNNGMNGAVRSVIGQLLIKRFEAAGEYDRAIDMLDTVTKKATDTGQFIQAFSLWSKLSPEGQMRAAQKTVNEQRTTRTKKDQKNIDKTKKATKKAVIESIDEALENVSVKKRVNKAATVTPKAKKTVYGSKNKFITNERAKQLREKIKGKFLSGLDPEIIEYAAWHIEASGRSFAEFSANIVNDIGAKVKPYLKELYTSAKDLLVASGAKDEGFSSEQEVIESINEDRNKRIEAQFDRAIKLKNEKDFAKAISMLMESDNRDGIWNKYKKYAASRLKTLAASTVSEQARNNPILQEFIDGLVKNIRGLMIEAAPQNEKTKHESTPPIRIIADAFKNFEKYTEVWEKVQAELKEKYKDSPQTLAKLDAFFGNILDQPFSSSLIKEAVFGELKSLDKAIAEIAKAHYTVYDATKKTLTDKLIDQAGLSPTEAQQLSDAISKEFDKIFLEKRQAMIKALSREGVVRKKAKDQLEDNITSLINLGAFDDADFLDSWAEANGYPKLTKENIAEIKRLADAVQTANEGFQKFRAIEDLLSYQAKIKGISWTELGMSVWYANMLSGYTTQLVNIVSTATNGFLNYITAVTRNPADALFLARGYYQGLLHGFLEGGAVIRTGYNPIRGKVEVPAALEAVRFKGGKLNPFNYHKFVRRLMVAADVVFYEGAKEMRAWQLAKAMASKENKIDPDINTFNRAIAILNKTDQEVISNKEVAQLEYQDRVDEINQSDESPSVKKELINQAKRDLPRRIFELMHLTRDVTITEESAKFAARATYNYTPEGILGELAHMMNFGLRRVPALRLVVPFTNIIANVANETLNFTPYGFVKGLTGGSILNTASMIRPNVKPRVELTDIEKTDLMTKAMIGTSLMTVAFILSQPTDDDDEPILEITGSGFGQNEYKKNYLLKDAGWHPYSFRIKNPRTGKYSPWISYQYTPLIVGLGFIGAIRDAEKYKKEKLKGDDMKKYAMAATSMQRVLFDMTFLSSLDNLLSSALNPQNEDLREKTMKGLSNTAKTFIIPNLYSQGFKLIQEVEEIPHKQVTDVWGGFLRDIPVARDRYNDMVNALGDPVIPSNDKFTKWREGDPLFKIIIEKDMVNLAVPSQKTLTLTDPSTGDETAMTNEEYYNFCKIRGSTIKSQMLIKIKNDQQGVFGKMWMTAAQKYATKVAKKELNDRRKNK